MQRLVLVLLAATLSFSMSGFSGMFVPELCTAAELSGSDNTCPPSCVTCGCCHRSMDVTSVGLVDTHVQVVADPPALPEQLRSIAPREILHVPKLVLT